MLSEILAVFVVTLSSSFFLTATYVHGSPKSSLTPHNNRFHPSADLSSSLRLLSHHPRPSIDYDQGGDIAQMVIGDSNELSTMNNYDGDSSLIFSSFDATHEPLDFYRHLLPSKSLSRKLVTLLNKQDQQKEEIQNKKHEDEQRKQQKRTPASLSSTPPTWPAQFNSNAGSASRGFTDGFYKSANPNHSSEGTRLSPGLKLLVEKNPLVRIWLSLLIQKLMEEKPAPYIFKYGRRRKK